MEVDEGITTDIGVAKSEGIGVKENLHDSRFSKTSNLPLKTVTSAELTPLDMISAELAPLQPVKLHNVTTVEVSKDSTSVDMDGTLTNAAYPVYARSLAEAEEVLHRFENDTKNRYSVWRCPKDFGSSRKHTQYQVHYYLHLQNHTACSCKP